MARTATSRDPGVTIPKSGPQTVQFLANPKGINTILTPEQMGPDDAVKLENFFINRGGKLQVRGGTARLAGTGDTVAETPVHICTYTAATTGGDALPKKFILRWTAGTLSVYDGTTWYNFAATGAPDIFSFGNFGLSTASWGSTVLLFCCDSKVYALDTIAMYNATGTYTIVTNSPAASDSVAVFNNRAIVCVPGTNYSRVQWSVKDDYTDWSGTGSGYEDVIPGFATAAADKVLGLFPINDLEALLVRTDSIWIVTPSGDEDAPFNFKYLFPISTISRKGIVVASGGLYIKGIDDIYFISTAGIKSIGNNILAGFSTDSQTQFAAYARDSNAFGVYDSYRKCFCLLLPTTAVGTIASNSTVLMYHEQFEFWTTLKFPMSLRAIAVHNSVDYTGGTYTNHGIVGLVEYSAAHTMVLRELPATTTDCTDSGSTTTPLVATAILCALPTQEINHRVMVERIGVEVNGGTQTTATVTANFYAPSIYMGVTSETFAYGAATSVTTNKLRARKWFLNTQERNGIVPEFKFTSAPMLILNSIDITFGDAGEWI